MSEFFTIIGATLFLIFFFFLTYVGIHMVFEKDAGKRIPLPWEQGGFLNKAYHKVFDKNNVKYRDGDNT